MTTGTGRGASAPLPVDPTGIESGKRIIICGSSPHVLELSDEFLDTGVVLGLNQWPWYYACDYWLAVDTASLSQAVYVKPLQAAMHKGVVRFLRHPDYQDQVEVPKDAADYYFRFTDGPFPTQWDGTLVFKYTAAISAINLAIIMGAKEIVLYGVDFVGQKRFDTAYSWCWHECAEEVNVLLREFQKVVPIYKLHPDSPLDVPLMTIGG